MAIEDLIVPIGEAIGMLVNAVLRGFGIAEIKADKIVNFIAYSFFGTSYIRFVIRYF